MNKWNKFSEENPPRNAAIWVYDRKRRNGVHFKEMHRGKLLGYPKDLEHGFEYWMIADIPKPPRKEKVKSD